jgi:glycosyltransferase involved in cell wall biosynthesis
MWSELLQVARLLSTILALARRMRSRGIAVVHSFDFYTNILALPAARLAGVRAVIGSQRNLGNLRSPAQQVIHDLCLRLATHIHVNSEAVRERVLQSRGISRERLTVIPNGVDLGRFSPRTGRPRDDTGLVVGALSNLRPEKGWSSCFRRWPWSETDGRRFVSSSGARDLCATNWRVS